MQAHMKILFLLLLLVPLLLGLKPTVQVVVEVEVDDVDLEEGVHIVVNISSNPNNRRIVHSDLHEVFSPELHGSLVAPHHNQGNAFGALGRDDDDTIFPDCGKDKVSGAIVCTVDIIQSDLDEGKSCSPETRTALKAKGCEIGCGFDCGHILANALGGSGSIKNAFCQPTPTNMKGGDWNTMETDIKKCLQDTEEEITATLKWTFTGDRYRPSTVLYEVDFEGEPDCVPPKPVLIKADECVPSVPELTEKEKEELEEAAKSSVLKSSPNCDGNQCTFKGLKASNFDTGFPCSPEVKKILKDDGCEIGCGFDCGHVLANKFGGDGSVLDNVFCQSSTSNRGGKWKAFETQIKNCLSLFPAGSADLTWTFEGGPNRQHPEAITYQVKYSNSVNCFEDDDGKPIRTFSDIFKDLNVCVPT